MNWNEKIDIKRLFRKAKLASKLRGAYASEDAVQDILRKDLEEDLVAKAERSGKPIQEYFDKAARNRAKDLQKRERGVEFDESRHAQEDPHARSLSDPEWLLQMQRLLSKAEGIQAEKDLALLIKHQVPAPTVVTPANDHDEMTEELKRLAWVLAVLATPGAPRQFHEEDVDVLCRWACLTMFEATDLRNHAEKPGRKRPMKKLVSYAEALLEATWFVAKCFKVAWLPPILLRAVSTSQSAAARRIAALCTLMVFILLVKRSPELEQRYLDLCASKKRGASRRNGHVS